MSLFDLFKNKKAAPAAPAPAPSNVFTSGAEALDYACKYLECPLRERSFLPALVVVEEPDRIGSEARLRVVEPEPARPVDEESGDPHRVHPIGR